MKHLMDAIRFLVALIDLSVLFTPPTAHQFSVDICAPIQLLKKSRLQSSSQQYQERYRLKTRSCIYKGEYPMEMGIKLSKVYLWVNLLKVQNIL